MKVGCLYQILNIIYVRLIIKYISIDETFDFFLTDVINNKHTDFEKINFIKTSTKIDNTVNYNSINVASVLHKHRRPPVGTEFIY